MDNYLLYPVLELKGYIIFMLISLVGLTIFTLGIMKSKKRAVSDFGVQAVLFGRTKRELLWLSINISQLVFVLSFIVFRPDFGMVQIVTLAVLFGVKVLIELSPAVLVKEALFTILTGVGMLASNLLIDYMDETGFDTYIAITWGLLSLFLLQYSMYSLIKGIERILQQNEKTKLRKVQKNR